MKRSFALYGDEVFSMNEPVSNKFELLRKTRQGTDVQTNYDSARINIDLGIVNDKKETNKETSEKALELLTTNRVTSIRMVFPVFEIAIAYKIANESTGHVLDEGVMVRHIKNYMTQNKFYILGIDNENEMYHKLVKEIQCEFKLRYSHPTPCGITGHQDLNWVVSIENISVCQLIDYDSQNDFELDDHYSKDHCHCEKRYPYFHNSSEGVAISRDAYIRRKETMVASKITVFDSTYDGFVIHPKEIRTQLRELVINISLVLDNYFLLYDESSISKILYENKRIIEEESKPINPPEEETPDDGKEEDKGEYPNFGNGETPPENSGNNGDNTGNEEVKVPNESQIPDVSDNNESESSNKEDVESK